MLDSSASGAHVTLGPREPRLELLDAVGDGLRDLGGQLGLFDRGGSGSAMAASSSTVAGSDLEVAQFVYLLFHNGKIRDVIDTVGRKGVLLLRRFTEGRIAVLKRLREELRKRGYLPIVFNFDKPETKDFTETVRLLAGLSKFVIADITKPKSAPLELQATVPEIMVPYIEGERGHVSPELLDDGVAAAAGPPAVPWMFTAATSCCWENAEMRGTQAREMPRAFRCSDVFSPHPLGLPREEFSEPRLGRTYDLFIQRPNERVER